MSRLVRCLFLVSWIMVAAGCATSPGGYSYRYDDRAYYAGDVGGDYYYEDDSRGDAYWRDTWWPYYATVLRPVYSAYYDPFFAPGFYYGVTYFPRYYGGWYGPGYGWPYAGFAYSPYRYAWWDNYYDWAWYQPHRRHDRHDATHGWRRPYDRSDDRPRYGSASNAAERLASQDLSRPRGRLEARPRAGGLYDDGARARDGAGPGVIGNPRGVTGARGRDGVGDAMPRASTRPIYRDPAFDAGVPGPRDRDAGGGSVGNPRARDGAAGYRAQPRYYAPDPSTSPRSGSPDRSPRGYAPQPSPRAYAPSPSPRSYGPSPRGDGGSGRSAPRGGGERSSRDRDPNPN